MCSASIRISATLRKGNGRILSGHFNPVLVVDLSRFEKLSTEIDDAAKNISTADDTLNLLQYHLTQVQKGLHELKGRKPREARSINWIGSVWKWLAGNPDAVDWDTVLRNKQSIEENNKQQYKINRKLFEVTHKVIGRFNKLGGNHVTL